MSNHSKGENKNSSKSIRPYNRFSLFNETYEKQSSLFQLKQKKLNYTDITPSKDSNIKNKRNSNFIVDLKGLGKVSTFENKASQNNKILSAFKNVYKSNFLSTNRSLKLNRNNSIKTLEKDIQQKILDISMKIDKETTIGIGENKSGANFTNFIKKKLGQESENANSLLNKVKTVQKSISYFRKKYKMSSSLSDDSDNKNKSCNIPFSKYKKIKKNKFRVLIKKKLVYDSFDSEEDLEELDNFFISPENIFIKIFDLLIVISSLFNVIYFPYYLSNIKCLCASTSKNINLIYYFIDTLFIIDLILGFFRAYINSQFQIIKNNHQIIKHYLITQCFLDLIMAIPFFSFIRFQCNIANKDICWEFNMKTSHIILILLCSIKHLKIVKILNKRTNFIYYKITILISRNDYLEKLFNIFMTFVVYGLGFYFFISVHIFIGQNSYPNWIIKSNSQNKNLFALYLTSFYYLITTMTTVGYGDIVCYSFNELIFQIILLSVGLVIYSWIVSNIGNYIKNESYASIQYNKDEAILEEIRISYPEMPFKLYNKIFHHLNARKMRQKHCNSNILINSLPYSLKNKILLTMYQKLIENFKFFRGNHNTDFTLRILMNLLPLFSKKNAILIREGQIIENIIFVKEGRLCLEALINIKNPYKSVKEYLFKNFIDINEEVVIVSNYETSINASKLNYNYQNLFNKAKNELDTIINNQMKNELNSSINESKIGKELGKWDFGGEIFEENDYHFINIINISKNESYGNVHMFLSKPSPLCLRVKSKNAELLLLRKYDAFDISIRYPNIWAKIFKKSYLNMLAVKKKTIQKIENFWQNLGKKSKISSNSKSKDKSFNIENKIKLSEEKRASENISQNFPKIQINNETIDCQIFANNNYINNTNIISFSNKKASNNFGSTNYTTGAPLAKSQCSDTNKYISFGRASSKLLSCKNSLSDKYSRQSSSNYSNYKNKSQKNLEHFTSHRNIRNIRIDYINKLNTKIKKIKKSKKYYKEYCKKLLNKLKKYETKEELNNINTNEIMDFTFESIDKIHTSSEFNSGIHSSLKKQSESQSSSLFSNEKTFLISSPISLSFPPKYKNLDKFTLGEYSRNRNLRLSTENFIKYYLLKIREQKDEKIIEQFLTKKSFNSMAGDLSSNHFYTNNQKLRKIKTRDSYSNFKPKRIISYTKEVNYLPTIYDKKFLFHNKGKNKISNSKFNNSIKRNTLKKYIINKTSSFDSVKNRTSLNYKNINKSNRSSCSSYKKAKDEIHKMKTKNEYEQEIEFKNTEKKSPQTKPMKIKVKFKELNYE